MQERQYPPDTGPYATLSEEEKRKRLDAMVRIWQSDTERRIEREGYRAFITAMGLDEYRFCVWMRYNLAHHGRTFPFRKTHPHTKAILIKPHRSNECPVALTFNASFCITLPDAHHRIQAFPFLFLAQGRIRASIRWILSFLHLKLPVL